MTEVWKLDDNTGTSKGYLRLTCNGKRVCDFFPYAHGANEAWVRERAAHVTKIMSMYGEKPWTPSSAGAANLSYEP